MTAEDTAVPLISAAAAMDPSKAVYDSSSDPFKIEGHLLSGMILPIVANCCGTRFQLMFVKTESSIEAAMSCMVVASSA